LPPLPKSSMAKMEIHSIGPNSMIGHSEWTVCMPSGAHTATSRPFNFD
jgi:hypothetical protein